MKVGKTNKDIHLEGFWDGGVDMDGITWAMDVGDGRILMEEDRVEGFGSCLEEDDMEVFGSLNVNFS